MRSAELGACGPAFRIPCLPFRSNNQAWAVRPRQSTTSGRLLLTEVGTILGTCLSGAGIAQIKALGIRELLADGQLVDLFPDWPDKTYPLYALYPSRHLPAAKVRAAPTVTAFSSVELRAMQRLAIEDDSLALEIWE